MIVFTAVGAAILGWWQGDVVTLTGLQGKILGAVGLPLVLAALFFVIKWLAAAGAMWRAKEEEIRAFRLRLVEAECGDQSRRKLQDRMDAAFAYLEELEGLFKVGDYRRVCEAVPIARVLELAINSGAVAGAGAADLKERRVALLRIVREHGSIPRV